MVSVCWVRALWRRSAFATQRRGERLTSFSLWPSRTSRAVLMCALLATMRILKTLLPTQLVVGGAPTATAAVAPVGLPVSGAVAFGSPAIGQPLGVRRAPL